MPGPTPIQAKATVTGRITSSQMVQGAVAVHFGSMVIRLPEVRTPLADGSMVEIQAQLTATGWTGRLLEHFAAAGSGQRAAIVAMPRPATAGPAPAARASTAAGAARAAAPAASAAPGGAYASQGTRTPAGSASSAGFTPGAPATAAGAVRGFGLGNARSQTVTEAAPAPGARAQAQPSMTAAEIAARTSKIQLPSGAEDSEFDDIPY